MQRSSFFRAFGLLAPIGLGSSMVSPASAAESGEQPVVVGGKPLTGNAVIRHESGSFIEFTAEGDIFVSPVKGRGGRLGPGPEVH
jgi:hypothetical protein